MRIDFNRANKSKQEIFDIMKSKGVVLNLHYIPVHLQPYYQRLGFAEGDFPNSESYYGDALTLPLYYDFTDDYQDWVVESLREALR